MSYRVNTFRWLPRAWVLTALLGLSGCGPSGPLDAKRPVVVLVTLDTTRADYLGCYGAETPGISPRIDELAGESVLFTHAISQAAVTPVSHASIMTGLWPYHHGLRVMHGEFQNTLEEAQVTLAEVLRERGYDTGAFVSALPVTEYFGFAQGFDHFDADFASKQVMLSGVGEDSVNTGELQRNAGDTTSAALTWMAARENPFFLWLHYFDVHDEQLMPPPEEFVGVHFDSDDRTRRRELYRLELTYMDRELGRVFDQLKAMNLWETAVIIVTSDHGEGLGDHDWWTHGVLYQEQVRVPLIIKGPGIAGARRIEPVVRSIDIVPTVADFLNLSAKDLPPMDGTSLMPLMDGSSTDLGLVAYTDSVNLMIYNTAPPDIVDHKNDMLFGVVLDNRWKYISHMPRVNKNELYDLKTDPKELNNLYRVNRDMAKRAEAALKALPFFPEAQVRAKGTPQEMLDKLKAMGYAGVDEHVEPPRAKDDDEE